jgi:hypothetical protein
MSLSCVMNTKSHYRSKESKILIMMYRHKTEIVEFTYVCLIKSVNCEVIYFSCCYLAPVFATVYVSLFRQYVEAKLIRTSLCLLVVIVNSTQICRVTQNFHSRHQQQLLLLLLLLLLLVGWD